MVTGLSTVARSGMATSVPLRHLVMRRRSDHQVITVRALDAGDINGIQLEQPFQALTGLLHRFQPPVATGDCLDESA